MKNTRKKESFIYLIPVFVILAIFPLFLRLYQYDNGLSAYAWMWEGESLDLFLHGKMLLFEVAAAACTVLLFVYLMQSDKLRHLPKAFFLLAGYAALALISTLASEYRKFGFSGIHEQFENIWCVLGYVFVIVYIYLMVHDFKYIKILMYGLLAGSLVIGTIGVLQFVGADPVISDFFQSLYIPAALKGTRISQTFSIGTVYMTLYNPDYVGLYTSLVCPAMLALFFYHDTKVVRVLSMISAIMLSIGTVGAGVSSGYIGFGVSLFVFFVLSVRKIMQSKRSMLAAAGGIALLIVFIGAAVFFKKTVSFTVVYDEPEVSADMETAQGADLGAGLSQEMDAGIDTGVEGSQTADTGVPTESEQEPSVTEADPQGALTDYKLERITETDDYVEFCYDGIIFRESMRVENGMVYLDFMNVDGEEIAYDYNPLSMTYVLTEPGLEGIRSYSANMFEEYVGFVTEIGERGWMFTRTYKDEVLSYYALNTYGHLDKNITSESAVFTNHYGLFNGRGYIWAKTIPLLKDHILLGSGADSFSFVFPQSDYLSAYKGGYTNILISKPHCAYMQIAVQTGILSLILLLAFYLWYTGGCLKLYFWKEMQTLEQALAAAIFAGTAGFMVISLVNDSTICVTPVFAALIGIGIALNRMNKEKSA